MSVLTYGSFSNILVYMGFTKWATIIYISLGVSIFLFSYDQFGECRLAARRMIRSLLYLDICKSESLVCKKVQKSFNCPAYICLFSSTGPLSCTLYSAYLQHFKVCRENKKVLHVFVGFSPLALSAITKFTWQRPVRDFFVYGKEVFPLYSSLTVVMLGRAYRTSAVLQSPLLKLHSLFTV